MENLKIMLVKSFDFFADVWVAVELEDRARSCLVFKPLDDEPAIGLAPNEYRNLSTYALVLAE